MKRIFTVSIVLAAFTYFVISCRKIDSLHQKACRLTAISLPGNFNNIGYKYVYNDQRLLQKFTVSFTNFEYNFYISYNAKQQPVEIRRDSSYVDKIIYENDRAVRVDEKQQGGVFQPLCFFKYDGLGRLIERRFTQSPFLTSWDYYGSSLNYKHKTVVMLDSAGNPTTSKNVYEYKYDDKINPLSTFPNINFYIFFIEFYDNNSALTYDPISENNVTEKLNFGTFEIPDSLFNYATYFNTYTYNDGYPVSQHSVFRQYNRDRTFFDETVDFNYSYNCLGDKGFPKQ